MWTCLRRLLLQSSLVTPFDVGLVDEDAICYFLLLMALNKHVILTVYSVAFLGLLFVAVGLNIAQAEAASESHGHTHAHTHDGYTHTHWHMHAEPEGDCGQTLLTVIEPDDPHDCCCHFDHSHPAPLYALTETGQRWDDRSASMSHPLPDLWQPMATMPMPQEPIPPPPRAGTGDPLSQLRTVVLLT